MSDKRAAGGVGPYGCNAVGSGANLRDVEDAVPYLADPRLRAADYPSAYPTSGGASPSPTAQTHVSAQPIPFCASDAGTSRTPSPTGLCENAGVVRRPREGQAPPLRRRLRRGAEFTAGRRGRRPLRGRPTSPRSRLPFRVSDVGRGKPLPYGADPRPCAADYPFRASHAGTSRTPSPTEEGSDGRRYGITGGASPSPTTQTHVSAQPIPFRASDAGRGKPLPYGDGCAGVRNVQRDVEDAVPYGRVAIARVRNRGRLIAAPTGAGEPGCGTYSGMSRTPSPTG